jgi:hypothetical protein
MNATAPLSNLPTTPGIYDLPADDYHAGPGISKSGLWTLYNRTPYHYKYEVRAETSSQRFGTAAHTAVLEPELFTARFVRGPVDRRGNKWTDACKAAVDTGRQCLTESEYDDAQRLRDALHRNPLIQRLTAGQPAVEKSGYWIDPQTEELCRCRPDLYNPDLRIMGDLKSTTDASAREWVKRVADYGFHVQEAFYRAGWEFAGGGDVEGFVFITVEKSAPFAHAVYELDLPSVAEGAAVARKALEMYRACRLADQWPGYAADVQELALPRWAYKEMREAMS